MHLYFGVLCNDELFVSWGILFGDMFLFFTCFLFFKSAVFNGDSDDILGLYDEGTSFPVTRIFALLVAPSIFFSYKSSLFDLFLVGW